jgi:hypothetical protein
MEVIPYGGWERCARLRASDLEAVVTLEVGPRVIRFGLSGGPNELVEYAADLGKVGGTAYRSYGGHRLWVAPEDREITYEPDNTPVQFEERQGWWLFSALGKVSGLRKTVALQFDPASGALQLDHRLRNEGPSARRLAPWCLTVMAPGGECLIPMPEFKRHDEELLPAAPLVLWHYTRMSDPRWTWGARLARLRHDPHLGPQKCGMFVRQGWAAYANGGNLFLKRFGADRSASYPDFGCNFETFTRQDMLEVESLGPLQTLAPGEEARHLESWRLFPGVRVSADDTEAANQLDAWVAQSPAPSGMDS